MTPRPPWRDEEPRLWPPPARYAWPTAVAGLFLARYWANSLTHRREGAFGYHLDAEVDPGAHEFMVAAESLTGAPISEGNEAELLVNGDEIFPAMIETIAGAERTLTLQTYIYWRGDIADEFAAAICERARAGVRCLILLDAVGSLKMDSALFDRMCDAGAQVVRFRPPKPYAVRRLVNRTHRRVLVADGRVGMTGGVGIGHEWTGNAEDPEHWRDNHVRVRGPVVRGMQGTFGENWLEATGEVIAGEEFLPDLEQIAEGGPMQFVRSRAGVGDTNIEALYYLAIASARESIDLTAAYFAPRPAFTEALAEAAERGVRLRILVPGPHIDKQFVRIAGRAAYARLHEAGAEIHEYQPTMLHAKSMVVDGVWSSIGSVNFDNRSFQLNDEATLCIQSDAFAARMTEVFERDLGCSERIDPDRWSRRGLRERVGENAAALVRRDL